MPELNEVLDQAVDEKKVDGKVVDVTTIDREPVAEKPAEEKKTPKAPVKKTTATVKAPTAKTEASETTDTTDTGKSSEINLRRPPMEQLTKDLEKFILSLKIDDIPIKKLEYKCGKNIFGLHNEEGKDFRVIAYKARKKTKTVAGKSRCIFFFGIHKDVATIVKQFPGTSTTNFGKCSVQCKKPIQLVLDKQTFADNFGQDIEKVMSTLKGLADVTIEQKTEQWKAFQEKVEAKKQASTEKNKAKPKKSAAGDE